MTGPGGYPPEQPLSQQDKQLGHLPPGASEWMCAMQVSNRSQPFPPAERGHNGSHA